MPATKDSTQERLFDYEVVQPFVELPEADDEMLKDFAVWMHWHHRDRTATLWSQFQRYLGAEDA
jgi:hypothetical protein